MIIKTRDSILLLKDLKLDKNCMVVKGNISFDAAYLEHVATLNSIIGKSTVLKNNSRPDTMWQYKNKLHENILSWKSDCAMYFSMISNYHKIEPAIFCIDALYAH